MISWKSRLLSWFVLSFYWLKGFQQEAMAAQKAGQDLRGCHLIQREMVRCVVHPDHVHFFVGMPGNGANHESLAPCG